MNFKSIALMIIIFTIFSCETSDSTFIDYLQVSTDLKEGSFQYTGDFESQELLAQLNSDGRIYGYGGGNRFYTDDLFYTIELTRGFISYDYFEYNGTHLFSFEFDFDRGEVTLNESSDQGITFDIKVIVPDRNWVDDDEIYYYPIDDERGWLLLGGNFSETEVIKINGSSYESKGMISGEFPASIYFDGDIGYALTDNWPDDFKTIHKTTDGGETWRRISSFNLECCSSSRSEYNTTNIKSYGDFVFTFNTYNDDGAYGGFNRDVGGSWFYVSRDGGISWDFIDHDNITSVQFISENTAYGIQETTSGVTNLYKSTNGGTTWSQVSDLIYADRIFFQDENNGLAMTESILQITNDGGRSWELLLFPIEN
ncbi:WD40/YVTN/BNR-like repeat-containing protein [Ekhidna sp.]|uniref:WD40/YVTN/BNR-like repeat-containing protein n=1 Tax=Ekhidna sp. TaxID=2608089 RepID=UPI003518462B